MSQLHVIADNPTLIEEFRALLVKQWDTKPSLDMTNEQLGEITRAQIDGLSKVDAAFVELARYQTPKDQTPPPNRAR